MDETKVVEMREVLYAHREDALTCYDHPHDYCCVCGVHKTSGFRPHLAEVLVERERKAAAKAWDESALKQGAIYHVDNPYE